MCLFLIHCITLNLLGASQYSTVADGDWQASETWAGGAIPVDSPDAVIDNSGNLLICSDVRSYSGALAGGTLEVTGSLTVLNGANTLTPDEILVVGGSLLLGASDTLGDATTLWMGDGAYFNLNGYSEHLGTLKLEGNSILDMGHGESKLYFSNFEYSSGILEIYNWSGNRGVGDGTDQIFFDTTFEQYRDRIIIYSDAGTTRLSTPKFVGNELVGAPEPSTWANMAGCLIIAGIYYRRRTANAAK